MNQFLTDYDHSMDILDACDDRNVPFYDFLKSHKFMFFDVELLSAYKIVKQLSDIFKRVEKRFKRVQNYNVSKSHIEAIGRDIQYTKYPWLRYDFRFEHLRFCIVRIKDYFYIHYDGLEYSDVMRFLTWNNLSVLPNDCRFLTPVNSFWTKCSDVVPVFRKFVSYFLDSDDLFGAEVLY